MATSWTIAIDWDRDGEFSGDDIVTDRTVWVNWFLGFREPYKDIAQNSVLSLVLDNRDRRFSPENEAAANPLAGKIQPLRPVRVTSDDGSTVRTHWSGWINMIEPAANKYGARLAYIVATGAMQFLKATETKIELQENQRSDRIIDTLINEVIFPPALNDSWVLGDPDSSKLANGEQAA